MKTSALFLSLLLALPVRPASAEDEIVKGPDRRHEIDLRIEALDARRAEISTTGPMTATLVGVAVTAVGGIVFGLRSVPCRDKEFGCEDTGFEPSLFGAGLGLLFIGGTMAVVAGPIWGVRAHRRNEIDAERDSLIEERDGLARALSRLEVHGEYRDRAHFVTVGVRF